MTIFEALRKDHEIQRELLDKLLKTSGDSKERDQIYKELKKELKIHANGEERYFYSPLIDFDKTQEHARHGIAEHHGLDEAIKLLDETDYSSPAWLRYAKDLQEKVEHHLKEEEHSIFQLAGKVLEEDSKEDLAKEYNEYMEEER